VSKLSVNATIKLSSPATKEFWEIPVLFEDEHLLALSKPPGLLTSPDRYDPLRPNLMKLLHAAIAEGKPWAAQRGLGYLMNAHRLDRETSGVILLAKSKPVLVSLANLFSMEKPVKTYLALVHGGPMEDAFEVDASLAPHPTQLGQMRVDQKNGKRSKTLLSVRERFQGYTLLECRPLTGRTHQIRVHLSAIGHPIVGDSVYGGVRRRVAGDLRAVLRLGRPFLHAERLAFKHPRDQRRMEFSVPLPADLLGVLEDLPEWNDDD